MLDLRPLDEEAIAQGLNIHLPDATPPEREALAHLAGGSLGAALVLAGGDGAELATEAERLIDQARQPDILALMTLGEKLGRMRDGLEMFGAFLTENLAARIRARAQKDGGDLQAWTRLLARLEQGFARGTGLNLEARQSLLTAARDIASVASRQGSA